MRSEEKFILKTKPVYGKEWIVIEFPNGTTWVPSFEDMVRIWRAIGELEDIAYPLPQEVDGIWWICSVTHFKIWESLGKNYQKTSRFPLGNKTWP